MVGFSAVPGYIALYYRLTIPKTPQYTFDMARDIEQGAADTRAYVSGESEGQLDELRRVQELQKHSSQIDVPKAS